ncbi:capsular polysaccharide synthesis protein [Bifidobacterium lemurum]|nr:capsular polysaccharide synthesis protein [Bifidobacterium lemurum]
MENCQFLISKKRIDQVYSFFSKETQKYIRKEYDFLFRDYNKRTETAIPFLKTDRVPVWTCWLTGINSAPELIRAVVHNQKSVLEGGQFDYRILTLDNYDQYVSLPGKIIDRFNAGIIEPAFFSDILRCATLHQNGGIWLDSTVLLSKSIPLEILSHPFYYAKGVRLAKKDMSTMPQTSKFATYFLACQKGSLFLQYLYEVLLEYWCRNDFCIEYLIFNDMAIVGLSYIELFQQENILIPNNNTGCEILQHMLSKDFVSNGKQLDEFTYIHKLARKAYYDDLSISLIKKYCYNLLSFDEMVARIVARY